MGESWIRSEEEKRRISDVPQVILFLRARHPQLYSRIGHSDPICFISTVKSSYVSPKGYGTYDVSDAKQ